MPVALTNTRAQYHQLASTYLITGLVVFGLVALVMLWMLVRYRARKDDDRRPSRKHSADVLETVYAVCLVGAAAFLITITFHTETREDNLLGVALAQPTTTHVNIVAAQWNWRFEYPGGPGQPTVEQVAGARGYTTLYVPANTPILFTGHSQDVLHDFWIPRLRFQRQMWPEHTERFGLVFPRPGRYPGLCAWFCGLYHDNMRFVAVALTPRAYRAWLSRQQAVAANRGNAT